MLPRVLTALLLALVAAVLAPPAAAAPPSFEVVAAGHAAPGAVLPDTRLRVTARARNRGRAALARPRVRLLVSLDRRADPADPAFGARVLGRLPGGRTTTAIWSARLPRALAPGARWLLVCAWPAARARPTSCRPTSRRLLVTRPPAVRAPASPPAPAASARAPAPPAAAAPAPPAPAPPPVAPPAVDPSVTSEIRDCDSASPTDAAGLTARFARAGGSGWTGGDGAHSIPLPDGRVLWVFGDSFLGGVQADRTRAARSTFLNNTAVVQDGPCLTTLVGGTPAAPAAFLRSGTPGEFIWPSTGIVEGGVVHVLGQRFRRTGPGAWDFVNISADATTLSLPDLRPRGLTPLPTPPAVAQINEVVEDGEWTYVFGGENRVWGSIALHVARVPRGHLIDRPWSYWDGTGWSADPAASAPVADGLTGPTVLRDGEDWVLVYQVPLFSPHVEVRRSVSPQGPWSDAERLLTVPGADPRVTTYGARVHRRLTDDGSLVLGWSSAPWEHADTYRDAGIYRPRFLPLPPLPAAGPPAGG